MMALLYYLAKVMLCSALLLLYYYAALRNKAFHQWNRFYLLSAVALSLALPFVRINFSQAAYSPADILRMLQALQSADEYLEAVTVSASVDAALSPQQWGLIAYAAVCVCFLSALSYSVMKVKRLAKTYGVQVLENVSFVNTAEPGTPFSFMRYVFWNREISLASESGQHIFRHEMVHVQEKHTLDKLFLQTVLCAFWCNPFFWIIRNELRAVHEFIADKKAVGKSGTEALATMILTAAYPQHHDSLVNPFFQTSIKRRLLMLTNIQHTKRNYLGRILLLPLLAIVFLAFSVRTKADGEKNTAKFMETISQLNLERGDKAVNAALDSVPNKQIESVDVNKTKDRITVYYTDGTCEAMTEGEAQKRGLINNGGYGNATKTSTSITTSKLELRMKVPEKHPLLILNDQEIAYDLLPAINPDKISMINVLKDASALAKYGEKGRNGVIEITLKDIDLNDKIWLKTDSLTFQLDSLKITSVKGDVKASFNMNGPVSVEARNGVELKSQKQAGLTEERIFQQVEVAPTVEKSEWRTHLEKQLLPYILDAAKKGMKPGNYTVNVRFIVEKDGSIADAKALNDPGYGLAEGAVRTVRSGPKWEPGRQNGKIVSAGHTQPITFLIQER